MAPRTRSSKGKGLEPNLYQSERRGITYFRYKHPHTGKMHGMGSDKAKAQAAARILNAKLLTAGESLVDRVLGVGDKDMNYLIDRYRNEHLPTKKLAAGTAKQYRYRLDRLQEDLGATSVQGHTVESVANYLDENFKKDPYIKHRNMLGELFRFAMLKGLRDNNPATTTYSKADVAKERQRMTLDQYQRLHAVAPHSLKIAMEIALVTLLGRHEVCNLKYTDEKDGALFVVRQKSQKNEWSHLRIEITPQLADIIRRSREDRLVSPYIVHFRPYRVKQSQDTDHWTQYSLNHFSRVFRLLRDSSGIFDDIPKEQRPTFHEIRALGAWLYEKAGYDTEYVQQLMAHGDAKMTEYYQSGHEKKWVNVRAELDLNTLLKG